MKLTYNNGETIVTVDGTQDEVFAWYKTFVHSQTVCESILDTAFVELINRKTSNEEADKAVNNVNNPVNEPRAGKPDEDGWMTWTATEDIDYPVGLNGKEIVDYFLRDGYTAKCRADCLNWTKFPIGREDFEIVKFRLAK